MKKVLAFGLPCQYRIDTASLTEDVQHLDHFDCR